MELILHSFIRCPFAIRVRFALHERGLPFLVKEEDLKNFSTELRQLHPEAKVPLLVHDGKVIYDSAIINEYLEEAFPETIRLMPKSEFERAEVRMWTHWCNQVFKPDVDRLKYGTARFSEKECEGIESKVAGHLKKIERSLEKLPWLLGDEITLADINLFPFVRQLARINPAPLVITQSPIVLRWLDTITARKAFALAMKS